MDTFERILANSYSQAELDASVRRAADEAADHLLSKFASLTAGAWGNSKSEGN